LTGDEVDAILLAPAIRQAPAAYCFCPVIAKTSAAPRRSQRRPLRGVVRACRDQGGRTPPNGTSRRSGRACRGVAAESPETLAPKRRESRRRIQTHRQVALGVTSSGAPGLQFEVRASPAVLEGSAQHDDAYMVAGSRRRSFSGNRV